MNESTERATRIPEEWRQVEGWPYEVSNWGNVRRSSNFKHNVNHPPHLKIQKRYQRGIPHQTSVYLRNGKGIYKNALVHILVCRAFHGNKPSEKHIVAHWDGDPFNNYFVNLRWATNSENEEDKRRHGTLMMGPKNHMAKLTEGDVVKIRRLIMKGLTNAEIAQQFGVTTTTIRHIFHKRTWGHLANV